MNYDHLGLLVLFGIFTLNAAAFGFAWSRHKILEGIRRFDSAAVITASDTMDRIERAVNNDRNDATSAIGDLHRKVDNAHEKLDLLLHGPAPVPSADDEWVRQAAETTGHKPEELERVGNIIRSRSGHLLIATVTINAH